MIRLIVWIFNSLILGYPYWNRFNKMCTFEEALEMMKKGYFIRTTIWNPKIYAMIDKSIYEFDLKKKTAKVIDGFNDRAINYEMWNIIPSLSQTNLRENEDD